MKEKRKGSVVKEMDNAKKSMYPSSISPAHTYLAGFNLLNIY
jgi:hypothetical protein